MEGSVARLRSLLRARTADARTEDEFRFHIEMQTEKNVARGMTPDEARRRALLEFGGVDRHREAVRDVRRPRVLAELRQDARFAIRSMRHSRGFTLTAVVIIALGVGATTSLFSLANALLFRPLPVAAPGELYMVQEIRSAGPMSSGPEGWRIPYTRYETYRAATGELFDGLSAHAFRTMALRADGGAEAIAGAITSGNYFEMLGLRPALGRFYGRDDEPVAVLSHRFWRTQYNEDGSIVGRTVHLDGSPYTVAGVAPRGFDGTTIGFATAVWLPFRAHRGAALDDRGSWVGMLARVPDREAVERTSVALSTIATQLPVDNAAVTVERAYLAPMTGLPESARAGVLGFMGMLLSAGFLVLLIAAANIAALLLARAVARQREIAIRLALGAGRLRLMRQLLTESTTLFMAGGAGGIALAYVSMELLSRVSLPGVPMVLEANPDTRVLAFALVVAGVTGLVFGLAPALRATRPELIGALKHGASSGATVRVRARTVFVAAQLAFATVLLITAGLFVRGLQHGLSQDPGFRTNGLVVGAVDLESRGLDQDAGRAFHAELLRRLRALPEVDAATHASVVLLTGNQDAGMVRTVAPEPESVQALMSAVEARYFSTLGIELVRGREFTDADGPGAPRVVIVNETLAARLWPGQDPVGQLLQRGPHGSVYEVVGVARDGVYVELNETTRPFTFYSAAQAYSPNMMLHVRGRVDAAPLIRAIRRELRALHADVALETAMPLSTMIGVNLIPQRFAAGLIGLFGLLGLILAAAGVYGVMSYQVAQRTREFGIRLALGATARDVLRLVVSHGAWIAAGGALAGIALAAAVTRLLAGLLFGLSPLDPVTFGAVALTLAGVALLASWIPARRALRVDPTVSLRSE
jgi:predicted permease